MGGGEATTSESEGVVLIIVYEGGISPADLPVLDLQVVEELAQPSVLVPLQNVSVPLSTEQASIGMHFVSNRLEVKRRAGTPPFAPAHIEDVLLNGLR